MYSAQGFFNGLYSEEDLPDSLIINPYDLGNQSVVAQRNGLIYGPVEFFEGYSQQVTIKEQPYPFFPEIGPKWVLELLPNSFGGGILDDNPCLFGERLNEQNELVPDGGPAGITDTFADSYSVECFDANGVLQYSDTYVRVRQCIWLGELSESSLVFLDGTRFSSGRFGWVAEVQEFDGFKTPPHNTPIGEYPVSSPETLFAGGKLVVSA